MCLFPIRAEKQEFGRPKLDPEGAIQLPCGKCFECKSKRAVDWALRARHEMSDHNENCFLTLTYDDNNLPSHLIVKSYFQKFIKRLRKKLHSDIRYMVSHEYGGKTGRPHHHAIIFGWTPCQQRYLQEAPSGEPLYTSHELETLWPHGYHSIGTANEKTAYYIASYSLKSSSHDVLCPDTGEYLRVTDSMDSSKRPAIGRNYFFKNVNQLIDSNTQLPRYYIKLLDDHYPDLAEKYENRNMLQNNKPKSAHQKLAKYIITDQQTNTNSEYRTAPDTRSENLYYINHLKSNRDDYQNTQRKKHGNTKHN